MGRGFLSGLFWGGVVSVLALFVSSQLIARQTLSFPQPSATEVEVPGGSEFNQARPETEPVVPSTDARPVADGASGVAQPDESESVPPAMDTAALEVPVPATPEVDQDTLGDAPSEVADITEPERPTDTSVETAQTEVLAEPENPGSAPVTPEIVIEAPEVAAEDEPNDAPLIVIIEPEPEEAPTEIAALPQGDADVEQPSPEAAPVVEGQVEAPTAMTSPEAAEEQPLPWLDQLRAAEIAEAPDAPDAPSVAAEPSLPAVQIETPAEPAVEEAPQVEDAPSVADAPEVAEPMPAVEDDAVSAAVAEAMTSESEEAAVPEARVEAEADGSGSEGSLLTPVETLTERETTDEGPRTLPVVRRLGDSSAGAQADEPSETETPSESADDDGVAEAEDGSAASESDIALVRNAIPFEPVSGLPLVSIVLVHEGALALPSEVLEALPQNVGFAVDASLVSAADVAATYRRAGREVVMIPALPEGAAPQDIEQALAANFGIIPEAVAVMDVTGSSFQSDRAAVEQVVDVVAASGHGMITFPRGLNAAHQAAQRAGVPTGLIFRNLDARSETQEQIRRSLDRAAFRARQDEAVILVGTTGSTMLSALTEWVLGNRAASVAIAPISAALGD